MHMRMVCGLSACLMLAGALVISAELPVYGQVNQQGVIQTNPGLLLPAPAEVRPDLREEESPLAVPMETVEPDLDAPRAPRMVELEADSFYLRDIRIEGNTQISDAELDPIVQPYEGRTVTLDELNTLVDQLTTAYRERGYLSSMAYITPQAVSENVLTVQILEGRIGEMTITGNKAYKAQIIAWDIEPRPGDPLHIPQLEENLMRANRLHMNDYRLRAALTAGAQTGETDVQFEVEERQPWQVALTFDNLGRPFIGTYRWGVDVTNRSLTGRGDRLNARWLMAAGTQLALGSYFVPLNRSGTELGAVFGYSHVDLDLDTPDQPEITGESFNYGLLLSQPLDRERVWTADVGFNIRDVNTFINDDRDSETDIRSLQLGLNFDKYDRFGRTFARVQNTFAPEWLGANVDFWKAETYFSRIFNLPRRQALILTAYGQFTPNDLPPAEQMQLGGFGSVRGYTQGLLLGDRGYMVSAEYRYPIPGLRRISPWLADRLQGPAFVDFGQVWLDEDNEFFIPGLSNKGSRTTLLGAGVGLRYYFTRFMQGFVDGGWGLLNRSDVEPNAQPTVRIHFGIRSELLPNDFRSRSDAVHEINAED